MSELPWSKFFWSDWEADQGLRLCSLAAQGLWMRMLCVCAKGDPKGYLAINKQPLDEAGVARLCGITVEEAVTLMEELSRHGVFSRDRRGWIYSRRMMRDAKRSATGQKHAKKRWSQGDEKKRKKPPPNGVGSGKPNAKKPEARGQKETPTPYGAEEAKKDWNDMAAKVGLPACMKLSDGRRKAISARLEEFGEDGWKTVLEFISTNEFFTGQNDRGWKAGIDYAARQSAFLTMLEKAQAEEGQAAPSLKEPETVEEWERRVRFYKDHGQWHAPGPEPGQQGCLAPPGALEGHGFTVIQELFAAGGRS